jgi:uncharacterized protein (DUF983 family)
VNEGRSASSSSPYRTGLLCRCPRCGEGSLYKGLLTVAERCDVCDLDLSAHDTGDGPAVFVILILGAVVVTLALLTESAFAPPLWVHVLLWPPLIFGGALVMLRVLKALLIALQYRHRVADFGNGPGHSADAEGGQGERGDSGDNGTRP